MKESTPQAIYLKDYVACEFEIAETHLSFELFEDRAIVTNQMKFRKNSRSPLGSGRLTLNGEELKLISLQLNGLTLTEDRYVLDDKFLSFEVPSDEFMVEIKNQIEPQKNLAFEGLYKSGGNFCTQCEAEGFRKITYFLDRPDVMSIFTVTIEADKLLYPTLLSNGNLVEQRQTSNARHLAKWHDPFKKPAYLFALVAGDFGCLKDSYTTRSGRRVSLEIYSRKGYEPRLHHAMASLKKAMKWDEEVFDLEYDLDIYMIVAVDDFNMGAMENKGLNIFNSGYVLADPETATDADYDAVLGVIGHEYFHNWTGNRVTCRDWFQLSLKEGLTVFRDQEFSADMTSRPVKRIEDVARLRSMQFAEDAGPMAHPVRPQSFIEINNFYTLTIYEKGSELIRMIHTMLGASQFKAGIDRYFQLYDGQAVTTEDFVHAMEEASGVDLKQFRNWYDQAGTPEVEVTEDYNEQEKSLTLTLKQHCPPTPGQLLKRPFHIPIKFGVLDKITGKEIECKTDGDVRNVGGERILNLTQPEQRFRLDGLNAKPVLSLLRNFSAPIKLKTEFNAEALSFLLANDSDPFNRWEAAQKLSTHAILQMASSIAKGEPPKPIETLINSQKAVLLDESLDPAFKAYLLRQPPVAYLLQMVPPDTLIDVDAIHLARETLIRASATRHERELVDLYTHLRDTAQNNLTLKSSNERSLKSAVLHMLTRLEKPDYLKLAFHQFKTATSMTDEMNALSALNIINCDQREEALAIFYARWKNENLVINKWFTLQAHSPLKDTLQRVQDLMHDPVFDPNNPNKIFSLFYRFANDNLLRFHDRSGAAYKFIADRIIDIDSRNPQVAARLVSVFNQWKRFDHNRQELMRVQLKRITEQPNLSANVYEIASKALQS